MLIKRYIQCQAYCFNNKKIYIDIEVTTHERILQKDDKIILSNIIFIPISARFSSFGIEVIFDNGTTLHTKCRQYEYVGSADEIIQRIINESE